MITIFSTDPLYFLSRLKGRFENSRSQTSDLNPIKSENTASIKKTPQSSVLSYQRRILFGISEVVLHHLLIVVALRTSRDIYHPISVAINTSRRLQPRTHLYLQLPLFFALLRLHKPCSGFLPPFHRSNQPYGWRGQPGQAHGGGGSREPVDEPVPPPYEVRSISSTHGDELF